jgi:hypothetical protein
MLTTVGVPVWAVPLPAVGTSLAALFVAPNVLSSVGFVRLGSPAIVRIGGLGIVGQERRGRRMHAPTSEAARDAARQSLTKYYGMIRNLADFPAIYLRVLDLQKAFPEIYTLVAPSVF